MRVLFLLSLAPLLSAQDQEPFPRPLPGATPPVQQPKARPPLRDPTVPDQALRNAMSRGQDPAQSGAPLPLPRGVVKAVVAADPERITVVVDIDGVQVQATRGGSFVYGGRTVKVERLDGRELVLRDEASTTPTVVELGTPVESTQDRLARVDFRGMSLEQACRLLADASGLNIAVSASAAAIPVSAYLSRVEPLVAIRVICEGHQLWWRADPETGVVRIATSAEYQRDLSELQEERTESFTLHYPNVFDVGRAVRELYGDRVTVRSVSIQDDSLQELADRLSRFDLFDGRQQGFGQSVNGNGLVGSSFGSRSRFGSGFGSGFGAGFGSGAFGDDTFGGGVPNGYGNQFPIRENAQREQWNPAQIQRIEALLSRLEATGGDSAKDAVAKEVAQRYRAPIHLTVAPRQNKVVVRTADVGALDQIRKLVASLDVPTALVLLEVRVLSIDNLDGFESFFEYQWADGTTAGQMTTGAIQPPAAGVLGPGGTGIRTGDLLFQYVDARFGARMQMLQRDNRVRTLATPILLTANNEVSRLFVGQEVPINRSFVGGATNQNESTTTTASGTTGIEFRPVGTTLLMTPSINADRTVNLKIVQEQSNVDATATVLIPSGDGFVSQAVNIVSSQTVSGTIVAKSDLAVAFGGLVETGKSDRVDKVPLLGDIPLLGILFRREGKEEFRREIVIVVKPYVIGTPAEQVDRSTSVLRRLGVDVEALEREAPGGIRQSAGDRVFDDATRPAFRVHGMPQRDAKEPR
ncbi:MAG: type II secretion system protein GspD [Planctomycetes bacterium]|nr:type II secretion system protein GspD [Planctomycetota bacterium]